MIRRESPVKLFCLSFFVMLSGMLLLHTVTPFVYSTNDDPVLSSVAAGSVTGTPEAHLLYLGYLFGLLTKAGYTLMPFIPWYGLILCCAGALALSMILYYLYVYGKSSKWRVVLSLIFLTLCYAFFSVQFILIQFTTITAFLGAGGLLVFYMSEEKGYSFAAGLILVVLAVSIRDKAFLMLLPFYLLISFIKLVDSGFSVKKLWRLLSYAAVLICVLLVNRLADSFGDWSAYREYNRNRAVMYDYNGYPDYSDNEEFYKELGISEATCDAIKYHDYLFSDAVINHDSMAAIADLSKELKAAEDMSWIEKGKDMVLAFLERHLSYADRPLNLLVYCFYPCIVITAFLMKRNKAIRDVCICFIARMAVWIYLLYGERIPIRVSQGIYLAELFLLIGIVFRYRLWEVKKGYIRYICLALLLLLTCRFGVQKANAAVLESHRRQYMSTAFVELEEYLKGEKDSFFYLDMVSFADFTKDALRRDMTEYANYLYMGGWIQASPWYEIKRERQGITNPLKALTEQDIYVVFLKGEGKSWDWLQRLIDERQPGFALEVVEEYKAMNGMVFQILAATKST